MDSSIESDGLESSVLPRGFRKCHIRILFALQAWAVRVYIFERENRRADLHTLFAKPLARSCQEDSHGRRPEAWSSKVRNHCGLVPGGVSKGTMPAFGARFSSSLRFWGVERVTMCLAVGSCLARGVQYGTFAWANTGW
jgi:hypothetical protein